MSEVSSAATAGGKGRYGVSRRKVPAFARYKGTSAWRSDRNRVKAYARFLAGLDEGGRGRASAG